MKRFLKISPYLILLFGFALRLYRLGANSLWYDETVSVYLAQSELAELIRHTAGDIHPPLYYLLLHFWGRVAGWSEFAMAFVSLWFGVLLIALVLRVTREWTSPQPSPYQGEGARPSLRLWPFQREGVATIAALFIAISPYNIWYSQEVRMYTFGATLGLLSVYFLRNMLAKKKFFSRAFFAYVIFTVLGFYTLYYFIFLILFEWVWILWQLLRPAAFVVRRSSFVRFLVSQLALALLYLTWLPIAFRQATDPPVPPWREFIALPRVILESFSSLAFGQAVDWNVFGFVALLLFIPIGALVWHEWKIRNSKTCGAPSRTIEIQNSVSAFFLLCYFLIPLAAIYLFSLWKPLYHVRYLFTYSPAFYILAAYALVNLANEFQTARRAANTRWLYGLGALGMLVSVGFLLVTGFSLYNVWHNEQYAKDDLRGAVNYIAERWRPGDVILVNAGYAYPALVYYFPEPVARERLVKHETACPECNEGSNVNQPLLLMTGSIDGAPNLGWGDARSDFYATTADETRAALERVLENYSRVWMLRIYDTVVDPQGIIRAYLHEHATLFEDKAFSGESQTRVQGFVVQPPRQVALTATHVNKLLGARVELAGYETGARELQRGEFFDVALYWILRQAVNYNYQVTLQLLNANGENVAQFDEMPLSEILPMTRWKIDELYREPLRVKIPQTLAPGEYRAIVKLYEPRSGEVLGDVVELGSVLVR